MDNVGRILQEEGVPSPEAGEDVSLTIDAGLQRAVYELIEQQLAGILYSKIEDRLMDEEGVQGSDLTIPVGDVYIALIETECWTGIVFRMRRKARHSMRSAATMREKWSGWRLS